MVVMTNTRWWTYLERLMGDDNAMTAANRAGISGSNFTRWKKGARADPDFVVKLARAYGANVLEALVEAEFITDAEASLREVNPSKRELLQSLTDVELAEEQKRRAEHTVVRLEAGMTRSEVEEQMARAVQMGLLFTLPGDQEELPFDERRADLAFAPSERADLRQSDHELAARDLGDEPVGRKIRRRQDEAGERPDPEGPEGGA